jgi:hypothetical protein
MGDEAELRGSDATGRHRSLKPSVLGVRFPSPASMCETGMNAKRTSDRFFKPDLESSSLSIPAFDGERGRKDQARDCGSR